MKKTIIGYIYNKIEKLGNKEYQHLGFEDNENIFGKMLEEFVPEIGMRKKVKITFETIENE